MIKQSGTLRAENQNRFSVMNKESEFLQVEGKVVKVLQEIVSTNFRIKKYRARIVMKKPIPFTENIFQNRKSENSEEDCIFCLIIFKCQHL